MAVLRLHLGVLLLAASAASTAVHDLNPAAGQTLKQAIDSGLLQSGDTAILWTGYHGQVTISGKHNASLVTVTAKAGHTPKLGTLTVKDSSNWLLRGLTISPTLIPTGKPATRSTVVTLAQRPGAAHDITLEDCFVYSDPDVSAWTITDWDTKPWSGINVDNGGHHITVRNTWILNTNFALALQAPFSLAEGNVIENFAGDGMRATVDDLTVQYNVIKNCYNVNDNHDDGIQSFLFNVGTGTVRRQRMLWNIILNQESDAQPFQGPLQGLGFFDGPLVDYRIEGNVVAVSAYHGISLYDAQNCTIVGNTVYDPWSAHAWIQLGSKLGLERDNTVSGNLAHSFDLASPGLIAANNHPTSAGAYTAARDALLATINERFGTLHPLTLLPRLGSPGNNVTAQGYTPYVRTVPSPELLNPTPLALTLREDVAGTLALTASERNGYAVAWTVPTQGGKGTASVVGSGLTATVTYAPTANQNGSDSFVVRVADGHSGSDQVTVNVTLLAVNDAPSFTKGADQTALRNAALVTVANWATALSRGPADEAAQTLSFLVSNDRSTLFSTQPAIASNGTLTFRPASNQTGSATVSVRIKDNGGTTNGGVDTSAVQTFVINVVTSLDAPVLALPLPNQTATVGSAFAFQAPAGTFTDPNGDALTWSASGLPAWLTFTPATRTFSGTPGAAGTATVTATATDPSSLAASDSFTITVSAPAPAPASPSGDGGGGGGGCGAGGVLAALLLAGGLLPLRRRQQRRP